MSDEVHTEAHGQVAEPQEKLDPETRARREAALKLVRKYGDPVLRSRALEIDRFDDALVEEVRRMGRLMHDAYGIGLAATQVGVLRRLLVFQAGSDSEPTALVNPEVEWLSGETVVAEEGCLSLPRVSMDVERPLHARFSGLDVDGEPVRIEASGLEARVLQHELDHLDGVLILDRAPRAQRKGALRAIREGREYSPPTTEAEEALQGEAAAAA